MAADSRWRKSVGNKPDEGEIHYEFVCHHCEAAEDKGKECAIGSLFALFARVRARSPWIRPDWYDADESEMLPGIYRITKWPIYWDAILDAGLYAESFEWVLPLPQEWARDGGYAEYPCGPLCLECRGEMEAEATAVKEWHERERMLGRRRG